MCLRSVVSGFKRFLISVSAHSGRAQGRAGQPELSVNKVLGSLIKKSVSSGDRIKGLGFRIPGFCS